MKSWYEAELTFVGRDQKEESFSDVNNDKITLDDIKVFADWQTNLQYCFGISIVSINFYGISITNPWLDETGRFELNNKHAIMEYGVKRYTKFIKEAIEALKTMKEYNIIYRKDN